MPGWGRLLRGGLAAAVLLGALSFPVRASIRGDAADLVLGQSSFTFNTSTTTQAGMYYPYGVAVDPKSNRVFVADSLNDRVLWWNSAQGLVDGQPADGVLGQAGFTATPSYQPAAQNTLNDPEGVAVDGYGNIWVADTSNNRVLEFSGSALENGMNASLVLGEPDFTSSNYDLVTSQSQFIEPNAVAVDGSGNVWVSDYENSRVLEFPPSSYALGNGANASLVLGQPDFTTNGCDSDTGDDGETQSDLCEPEGLAADASGNIWVSDSGFNGRVLEFSGSALGDDMNASMVLGEPDFTSYVGEATQSTMYEPSGITVDGSGNVWSADSDSNRVLEFSPPLSEGMAAGWVLGQSGYSITTPATTQSGLYDPNGLAADGAGDVWIADTVNNRVLEFLNPPAPSAAPANVAGTSLGESSISWTWNAVSGAIGYAVYSSTSPGVLLGDAAGPAFAELGLSTNTVYGVQVDATDGGSFGPLSGAATAATLAAPPTGFMVVSVSSCSITLCWAADDNPPGTLYQVQASASPSLTGGVTEVVSATTATLAAPLPNTTYYLGLLALNQSGAPSPSGVELATTTLLAAPAGLVGTALGVSSISWTWSAQAGASSYMVYQTSTAASLGTPSGASFVETGLGADSAASVEVAGVPANGTPGTPSAPITAYTLAGPATGLQLLGVGISTAALSWSPGADPAGANYQLEYWVVGGSTQTQAVLAATTATLSGLGAGTTYFADVRAVNGAGSPGPLTGSPVKFVTLPYLASVQAVGPAGGMVSYASSQGESSVTVPPGAFSSTVTLTLQEPPPGSLPPARSAAGTLTATGVALQVSLNAAVQPLEPVTLSLGYGAAGLDFGAAQLLIAQYDPADGVWAPLASSVNAPGQTATASVSALFGNLDSLASTQSLSPRVAGASGSAGLFELMELSAASSLSEPKAFPNPLRPSLGETEVTFSNLPAGATLKVYDILGEKVRELSANASGLATWDGKNSNGENAASGVYFVLAGSGAGRAILKVAIQR